MRESELRDAAQCVRRSSSELAALDPAEFEQLEQALRARGECIQQLAATAAEKRPQAGRDSEEAIEALAAARDQGAELLLRLRLARAATEAELHTLEREQQLLQGLDPQDGLSGSSVDFSG